MSWAAVAGAAVSVVGSQLAKDDGGGGGGGQSVSKEPWAVAAPWLQNNVWKGEALQNQYAAQPFSATQQRAYGQQFANSDYMRSLMNAVNSQAGGNRPFNRGSPGMVPQRYNLPSSQTSMQNMGLGPSYGNVSSIFGGSPTASSAGPAPVAAAPSQPLDEAQLTQLIDSIRNRRSEQGD